MGLTEPQVAPTPRHKSRRRTVALVAVLSLLVMVTLGREAILRGLGGALCAPPAQGQFDAVLLLNGDRLFDTAAEWLSQGRATKLLLVDKRHDRLVQHGLTQSRPEWMREALKKRGVPGESIELLAGEPRPCESDWDVARELERWLREHSDARVAVFERAFQTRATRVAFNDAMPCELADRVAYHPLRDRRVDSTTWWTSKTGCLEFFDGTIVLCFNLLHGEPRRTAWTCDMATWGEPQ